jgi:phosphoglycerate kinase
MQLQDLQISGRRVLIRVDFNVPLSPPDALGVRAVTDDTRIRAAVPTIEAVLAAGGSAVLMSHLGRPKSADAAFSLRHIVTALEALLGRPVNFATDCVGDAALDVTQALMPGEVALLENLRFHPEEKKGDEFFAGQLAENGDCFIGDAFGTAHRAHASTATIAKFFPNDRAMGLLMAREVEALSQLMEAPQRPVAAIIGGAKVSSKLAVLKNLLSRVDQIFIGGGMAYTFIAARGGKIGNSLAEPDMYGDALELLTQAASSGVEIILPTDALCADKFARDAQVQTCPIDEIPDGWMGLDLGPDSRNDFAARAREARTILWNGPMGVFEFENFSAGTLAMADALVHATSKGAFTLVGGGDSVAAINAAGLADKVSYVSTGGGAMLEYLEGRILPGIAALD